MTKRTVRSLCTKEEIASVENSRGGSLIVVMVEDSHGRFRGYHPLKSKIPKSYKVARIKGQLQTIPVTSGG